MKRYIRLVGSSCAVLGVLLAACAPAAPPLPPDPPAGTVVSSWGENALHNGVADGAGLRLPLRHGWTAASYPGRNAEVTSLVAAAGVTYDFERYYGHGTLSAYSSATGRTLWRRSTDQWWPTALAFDKGLLFFGNGQGMGNSLKAFDAATGALRWSTWVGNDPYPVVSGGELWVGDVKVDELTGKVLQAPAHDWPSYAAALDATTRLSSTGLWDRKTGTRRWGFPFSGNEFLGVVRAADHDLVLSGVDVTAFDHASGALLHRYATAKISPASASGVDYLPLPDGTVVAQNPRTTTASWTWAGRPGEVPYQSPLIDQGVLLVVTGSMTDTSTPGHVTALDLRSGTELWSGALNCAPTQQGYYQGISAASSTLFVPTECGIETFVNAL